MGKKGSFLPRGEMEKYLCCNADESEPGAFKDRELMARNPHQLIEGCAIAARGRRHARLHLHPRRVLGRSPTSSTAPSPRPIRRAIWDRHPRHGDPGRARRPPRRRRVHLRRGDGAARRARGQARQPAPEAAVSGNTRPLRRPDPDQQRRDALQRPPHRQQRRRLVQGLPSEQSPGTKVVSVSGCVRRPGTTRSSSGSRRERSSSTSPAGRGTVGG